MVLSAAVSENRPLGTVTVMSSHNTYIGAHMQFLYSKCGVAPIEAALHAGVRCIELDVNIWCGELVVAHWLTIAGRSIPGTNTVSLDSVLEAIKRTAFKHTDDPLFLSIENTSANTDALALALEFYFGTRLIRGQVDSDTLLSTLIGKVVLLSDRSEGRLQSLLNVCWDDHVNVPHTNTVRCLIDSPYCLRRVYPQCSLYTALFSTNFPPEAYLKSGINFVSMNFNQDDEYLQRYKNAFGSDGIRHVPPCFC